jgi:hypothetical protein
MQEANEFIISAGLGGFIEEGKAFSLQPFHFGFYIVYRKGNVVDAFSFFFDVAGNDALWVGAAGRRQWLPVRWLLLRFCSR